MPRPQVKTTDEERSQSRARVSICVVSLVTFCLVWYFRGFGEENTPARGLSTILTYLAFSISWYVMVRRSAYQYPWRRYISMVADLGIMTIFMHLGDRHSSAYYPIFLWIIIGNGIRFGKRQLMAAVAIGAVGFGSLLVFNPFWRENLEIGSGLLAGVIVLPVFLLTVLRRLEVMQHGYSHVDHFGWFIYMEFNRHDCYRLL